MEAATAGESGDVGLPVARAVDLAAVRAEVLEAAGKRGGTGGAQAEGAWSDWLGEVVVFLETSGVTHSTAVDAAAGLIAYGATNRDMLARAAGKPPDLELFRRSLRGEGIRPAVSDLLWGEFVAPSPAAPKPVFDTASRSPQGAFGGASGLLDRVVASAGFGAAEHSPVDRKKLNPAKFAVGQWVSTLHVDLKDKSGRKRAQVTLACWGCGRHTIRFRDGTVVRGVPGDRLQWLRNGDPTSCAISEAVGEEPCCGPQAKDLPALPDGKVRLEMGSKVLLTKNGEGYNADDKYSRFGGREGRVVDFTLGLRCAFPRTVHHSILHGDRAQARRPLPCRP